jgi:hypothetical protein
VADPSGQLPLFDPAGTQINDAFGTVMPDGSPRIVQLALRFVF